MVTGKAAREIDPEKIPWPDNSTVQYAFDGDKIVARSAVVFLPHIEGTMVEESYRGGTIAPRLIRNIESALKASGASKVFSFILNSQPEVAGYMERVGYKLEP